MSDIDIPIIIRPTLKRACCEGDACRAALFNQLLYSIARKVKQGDDYWYGSQKELCTILDNSWGLSKVIKELDRLVEQGFISQRRNPKNGWDQKRQYLFGEREAQIFKDACQKHNVCVHQMGFGSDVLHLLQITNAFVECDKCIQGKQQNDLVNITNEHSLDITNPFGTSNDAIPKSTTKKTVKNTSTKNNNQEVSQSAHPTHSKNEILFSPEEQTVFDWYNTLWFMAVPAKQTAGRKASCATLARFIHSQEDMESLEKQARADLARKSIRARVIELGNLVNSLNNWSPAPSAPTRIEDDPNRLVLWTRHIDDDGMPAHPGTPRDHWWLYELMPWSEAIQLGYDDIIPPAARNEMCNLLEAVADGRISLPKEAMQVAIT